MMVKIGQDVKRTVQGRNLFLFKFLQVLFWTCIHVYYTYFDSQYRAVYCSTFSSRYNVNLLIKYWNMIIDVFKRDFD